MTQELKINSNSNENQAIKSKFIQREVLTCFSYEMDSIFKASQIDGGDLPSYEDIENIYQYTCPKCGEAFDPDKNCYADDERNETFFNCPSCNKEYTSASDLDNEPQEILEYWIVTSWLYEKLKEKGEPVLEWGNNYYWGRCTSGQAIMLDGIITDICREMEILEGQKYDWSK